ncbi:LytTR family DNA-binding domain-containing protein [uncultured Tenacibaculum sp.]|uniref:LytR/AlgR family response regulator transcription factor n=1 Tax=uncultured Tenacibaculum sp. TaxID=174713 RepID=UPI00260FA26F|nr:LytTR family DNA-binding domain-containing protein [uncultured Tenacibaculum sp.]
MKISALIVDDENHSKVKIKKLINQHGLLNVIGDCSNGKSAIEKINSLNPDVIFLDVKVKDMTGFDIIEKITLPKKPILIFITTHNEFALKAFDYFVFDYLLKPFKEDRFFTSLNKIVEFKQREELFNFQHNLENILDIVKEKKIVEIPINNKKISVKSGNKTSFLDIDSIKYISASGYYIEIFTIDNKKYLLRESLSNIINRLNSNLFIRIHRSTIINSNYINEVITSNYGETDVKINDNKTFRISKGYKKEFQEIMGVK